ncbi:MAG: hypothetical protein QXX79_02905 [Candidatus Bathyarchaeia archaeon]
MPKVNAQPYFTVYPTEGSVTTDIFLQIRGLPGTQFYEYYYLSIFWDDILLEIFPDNSGTYDHYFDTHFSPPKSGKYSALGNHTVYFEVWNAGRNTMFINATFVFTIIEYFPCPEYVALNATYYSLLGNYSSLLGDYNTLLADYTELLDDYDSLSTNYYDLLDDYTSLSANYNDLLDKCDSLARYYDFLNSSYYELKSVFDTLKSDFNSLKSSNENLTSSYNTLVGEVSSARNLNYIFTATTLILMITTIYFAIRKPKPTLT